MNDTPPDLTTLATQLRYLLDRQEISDCLMRYARGVDRHDETLLASAFHTDAIDNHGPFTGTVHAIITWANDMQTENYVRHAHNKTCESVEMNVEFRYVATDWTTDWATGSVSGMRSA